MASKRDGIILGGEEKVLIGCKFPTFVRSIKEHPFSLAKVLKHERSKLVATPLLRVENLELFLQKSTQIKSYNHDSLWLHEMVTLIGILGMLTSPQMAPF